MSKKIRRITYEIGFKAGCQALPLATAAAASMQQNNGFTSTSYPVDDALVSD